jgi:cell division septation protein DedD
MMYHFDRKRLVVVKIALVLLCLLAYAGGVVTGIALWMPTQADIVLLHANERGAAPTVAAARLPVKSPALPAVSPPRPVLPAPPATTMPVKAASAPEPARPSPMSAMAAPLPAPAQPSAATAAAEAAAPEDDVFSLQIGTFRDPKNAKQLQADLKEKGYAASILTAMDSEQREWHAVRIHGFKTVASAARAATEFTTKERMQALIRRSDGL